MKHIHTFESFLNEGKKPIDVITLKKFTGKDHNNLWSWMQKEFGPTKYSPGLQRIAGPLTHGGDFTLDISNWDKKDIEALKAYLSSQNHVYESLNESTNRWYGKLLSLGRLKVGIKWVDELSYQSKDIKDFVSKHFPGVNPTNLAIVFKREVGNNWDKVKDILGGVLGDSKDSGEFVVVNAETA